VEFKLLQQSTIPPDLDSDCLKPAVFNTSRFITGYSSLLTNRTEHITKAYILNYVPWIINETNVTLRSECVGYKLYHNYWLNNLHAVTKLRLYNLTVLLEDNANSAGQIICCRLLFKNCLTRIRLTINFQSKTVA